MATKPASADADTMEEEAAAPTATNFEILYLFASVVFLAAAIIIMLMAAAKHYNAGIFAK